MKESSSSLGIISIKLSLVSDGVMPKTKAQVVDRQYYEDAEDDNDGSHPK